MDISVVNEATTQKYTAWVVPSSEILSKLPTTKGYMMLEVPKTKLKIAVYRLRDVEKILNGYNKTNISEWRIKEAEIKWKIKEAEIIVRQISQDLIHLLEGTDLKDVEKEIERLQQSLIS